MGKSPEPDSHGDSSHQGGRIKPAPASWPRSLAPLVIIFAGSLAIVLAILALT